MILKKIGIVMAEVGKQTSLTTECSIDRSGGNI